MDDTRPSWQVDACPQWCIGGHAERDHPDDRVHRSASVTVPVVVRRTSFAAPEIARSAESAEFEVAVSRVDGEEETWAYVGEGPSMFLDLSTESAARMIEVLGALLLRSR